MTSKIKVVVQIPCLNEAGTLGVVLNSIPSKIPGVDLDILVIDDGSSDNTIEVAKEHGVKHFVIHRTNMGLARSFQDGVNYALSIGADILVNTDGDNQYPQAMIPELIRPIMDDKAEIVVGDRQTKTISHFSLFKRVMQQVGSFIVNKAAGTNIPDSASGFRAYSKEALLRLNVVTQFSYCMETIIQAGNKNITIASVPITTNPKTRESRLFKNIWQHMYKSGSAIIRSYIMYRPHLIFMSLGSVFLIGGVIPFIRYALILETGSRGGHLQSLILGTVFLFASMLFFALAIISDIIRTNRTLNEEALERIKRIEYDI